MTKCGITSQAASVSMTLEDRAVIDLDTQGMFDCLPDYIDIMFHVIEVSVTLNFSHSKMFMA